LPFPRAPDLAATLTTLLRRERDLWYNPQRHVADAASLVAAKYAAAALSQTTHAERVERFHRLQQTTAELRPFVQPAIDEVRVGITATEAAFDRARAVSQRDYPFPLY